MKYRKKDFKYNGRTTTHSTQLDCGLRVAYKKVEGTQTSQLGYVVGAGSIDDSEGMEGTAHFFEHLLFRGTKNLSQHQIIQRIENIGGELNAFTGKEVTVVYSHVLSQYFDQALQLLTEVVLNNSLNPKAVDKERDIIKDEIALYEDSPEDLIYEQFTEHLFPHHSYGSPILGSYDSLKQITQDELTRFYHQFYGIKNMVLTIVSNIEWHELQPFLNRLNVKLGSFNQGEINDRKPYNRNGSFRTFKLKFDKGLSQSYLCLGREVYEYQDPRRVQLMLLNNILGGPGMNSKLNLELREKRALTYHIDSNYTAYSQVGIFSVNISTEMGQEETCIRLIQNVMEKLGERLLGERTFKNAKRQFINQLLMAEESKHASMVFNGKQLLQYGRIESFDSFIADVEMVSAHDIKSLAQQLFTQNTLSSITYS